VAIVERCLDADCRHTLWVAGDERRLIDWHWERTRELCRLAAFLVAALVVAAVLVAMHLPTGHAGLVELTAPLVGTPGPVP
jgi:hypothetical protein